MNNGPSILSSPSGFNLPDKPLVVKCTSPITHRQKLVFQSARNCTYDVFQDKIKSRFELTGPFAIRWQDDDGELNEIYDESSLNDAIDFYHSGEEGSVASSGSVLSSRSSRHTKITMHVQLFIDYDGLSLSDTASLASREGDSPEGSQISFSPGELASFPQDDDAVTVSSKDTRTRRGRGEPSLIKKILGGSSRAGSSSSPDNPTLRFSRSRRFNFGSRPSSVEERTTHSSVRDSLSQIDGGSQSSQTGTETSSPLGVFDRLRLEDDRDHSLVHKRSILQTEMGQSWLQDQSANQLNVRPRVGPSIDDSFSLNTDSPFSDTEISLQKDERGKYYYTYVGSGASESAGDLDYELVNGIQPQPAIPHELLVPEDITDCSECGCILDQIKYICTTCGEKMSMSRDELAALSAAAAAADLTGKGKSPYPPHLHRSATASHTYSNGPTVLYSSNLKPLPALPSTSPTQTIFYRNLGSQSTLVASSSSESSSPTARVGYELCAMCFLTVGLDHTLALSSGADSPSSPTLQPTPQALAIARRTAPKRKGELRHAFLFQIWGFNGWQDIEQDEISKDCAGCQSLLSGNCYKCGVCDNFPVCRACYSDVHNIHPIHPFLEMRVMPPSRSHTHLERSNGDGTYDNADEPSLKHEGVKCFNCQQDIVGARFRCVDCTTIDIDICSNCETAGLPGNLDASDGGHHSKHIMLKIPMPLNMHEVQRVSQRAHGLRHGRDRADLRGISPLTRSSPSSISSVSVGTVMYSNGSAAEGEDYVHLQTCNSCGEHIVGIRYQCLNCPSLPDSFNLCSDCEVKSYKVHDPSHVFLKIPRPVDISSPLESEFPIIPLLYRHPAGPAPGTPGADISGDPTAYLRDLTHAFALCDRHMMRIVGKWYRCAFCAKDLCADCEAIDSHDSSHVFLVFKAPIDMHAFRHFADLDNTAGSSPPVLRGDIYFLPTTQLTSS
ncbi:hypothetical protein BC827DRAFT_1174689 [Russula dissimulans]|nr:hypothetical protein BC827DRAFT_1174689 [Russula dissimulans]